MSDPNIRSRKIEHIRIVVEENVEFPGTCSEIYSQIKLVHRAFPGIDLSDVDLSLNFLNYKISAPLMISGMTGGDPATTKYNEKLALLAEEFRIPIGLGSERALVLHRNKQEILHSYRVVRQIAKDVPVIGNIGANTLLDIGIEDISYIINSVDVDALAIHLNPAQEAIQPEGDTRFNISIIEKIEEIMDTINVPIIIKEVGNGLSYEDISLFYSLGIRFFDVAGACGTNWVLVEKYRQKDHVVSDIAEHLSSWGIPTPIAVIEARAAAPDSFIIASGGVYTGLRAITNIVLGADINGLARPLIQEIYRGGLGAAKKFLETMIREMRIVSFLIGAKNVNELKQKPFILTTDILTYFKQRGIDLNEYKAIRGGKQ
ncbi:MAG: type 2 isopentenyl-diphosphate Delta-isomerase [Crenarchaeota archaeon]|nr:type 2 isopentenyl-diphosphate Delta-isomerase [Thermoproteota archaeon]